METGSVTVMPFLLFSILRKVMDENENDWDDFFTAPCLPLTPKSQAPPSLARSVYDVWSSTRLPLVLEQFMQKAENGEEINRLAAELTSEDALQDYIDKMATTRNVLFSKVKHSITTAQGKQKRQY